MVYFGEVDLNDHATDSPYDKSLRRLIWSMHPYKTNSLLFAAQAPPQQNVVDTYAPLAMLGLLGAFLLIK
jgi:hypothetical protein